MLPAFDARFAWQIPMVHRRKNVFTLPLDTTHVRRAGCIRGTAMTTLQQVVLKDYKFSQDIPLARHLLHVPSGANSVGKSHLVATQSAGVVDAFKTDEVSVVDRVERH